MPRMFYVGEKIELQLPQLERPVDATFDRFAQFSCREVWVGNTLEWMSTEIARALFGRKPEFDYNRLYLPQNYFNLNLLHQLMEIGDANWSNYGRYALIHSIRRVVKVTLTLDLNIPLDLAELYAQRLAERFSVGYEIRNASASSDDDIFSKDPVEVNSIVFTSTGYEAYNAMWWMILINRAVEDALTSGLRTRDGLLGSFIEDDPILNLLDWMRSTYERADNYMEVVYSTSDLRYFLDLWQRPRIMSPADWLSTASGPVAAHTSFRDYAANRIRARKRMFGRGGRVFKTVANNA